MDFVDLTAFAIVSIALTVLVALVAPFKRTTLNFILLIWAAIALFYFVILKRSSFRTVGYRLARVRITGLDGNTPSYGALISRLAFGMLGPLNWLLDLIWLSDDPHRQALRDKFANTYVVRANAELAGHRKIVYRQYYIVLFNFLFREVQQPKSAPRSSKSTPA